MSGQNELLCVTLLLVTTRQDTEVPILIRACLHLSVTVLKTIQMGARTFPIGLQNTNNSAGWLTEN